MLVRALQIHNENDLSEVLQTLSVDPYGIRIMAPKAVQVVLRLGPVPAAACHILKQEMLSCGGDVAVPRELITGKIRSAGCVVIGSLSQVDRLINKLRVQPFGLSALAEDLDRTLENFRIKRFRVCCGKGTLNIGARPLVMGIVNVTPDSFSGDGIYGKDPAALLEYALQKIDEGADIIDIGGESSRPGALPVAAGEEIKRTVPLIKKLARRVRVPISIDTCKPAVAARALDAGATIVNDISGLRSKAMARVIARHKAACIIMHMKSRPRTMQQNPVYADLLGEILGYLSAATDKAVHAGIDPRSIIIDPGIGFGKTLEHNLALLKNLAEFKVLGKPIAVGTSRKSFIGRITGEPAQGRIAGTIASCVLAQASGANIIRVHDVRPVVQALAVTNAILH
ncbi:MAG: dihydropteroate synthase [Candidatus Omnitrophica bacterium]|nr:dihydropteroate synthase [Candidatus Omnitrophota bacterium]